MASLFKKASETAQDGRVKIFLYGPPGCGKTTSALSFPGPVAFDFIEKGTSQYRGDFEFDYMEPNTVDELNRGIEFLAAAKHPLKTAILDPCTLAFESIYDVYRNRLRTLKKDPFYEPKGLDFGPIKKAQRGLIRSFQALDMNVIFISREKTKYIMESNPKTGKNELVSDGTVEDAMAGIRYEFDLVMRLDQAAEGIFQWTVEKFRGSRFAKLPKVHQFGFGQFYPELLKFIGGAEKIEANAESRESQILKHLDLVKKLEDIGMNDLEARYLGYIVQKYELSNPKDISEDDIKEQRKILNSLVGNEKRLADFRIMLEGVEPWQQEE